jgi:sarcosine oxidase subunit beta
MYVSQSEKGELVIGGGSTHPSYAQRGPAGDAGDDRGPLDALPIFAGCAMRWAGVVDVTADLSPSGKTLVDNPYRLWFGTSGSADPAGGATLAHTIAHDHAHPLIERLVWNASTGALVDEGAGHRAPGMRAPIPALCDRGPIEFDYGGESHVTRPSRWLR